MSQSVLVFHSHCPDGAASAVIARRVNRRTDLVYGQHEKINQQVLDACDRLGEGGRLYIADICCNESTLKEACAKVGQKKAFLGVYEHHITQAWLSDFQMPEDCHGEIVFDLKRCGAKIFYDVLAERYPDKLEKLEHFIELTNDRDLWLNKHKDSSRLSALHEIYGDEKYISRFLKTPNAEFSEEEKALLAYEEINKNRRLHRLLQSIEIVEDADGLRYGTIVGEGKASEICNAALLKFKLDYVCLVDFHSARVSLRSGENFDCAAFCEKRGGGGHARAAGFPIAPLVFDLHAARHKRKN